VNIQKGCREAALFGYWVLGTEDWVLIVEFDVWWGEKELILQV
jgi:hypothetical protein